jgi:hypothetical protein
MDASKDRSRSKIRSQSAPKKAVEIKSTIKSAEKRKMSAKPLTTTKKTAAKSTDLSSFSNTNKKARKFSTVVAAEKSLNYESGTD